ncbi:MAG: DUF1343 domain-containing protein [Ichthyobacteriaceae bacterium]|nr:DUF1343 domain-containing protein [Ichthyobacteriaceae bacterium]
MKQKLLLLVITIFALTANAQVKTGIEVLRDNNFDILKDKRVGLITNPTAIDRNYESTIDILAKNVNLVALYGPEHGVRGNFSAGDKVDDYNDPKTGVKVFSLYGKNRKPSRKSLTGVDVLVYDIQDIGVRSYTYISTLGLVMEAAAENNISVVVLDRPNPLGGERVEGPLVEDEYISFVSQFPIPYVYGFTPGEFAHYINEEGLLANKIKCDLTVVEMKNWKRSMLFGDTKLPWVATSPHIPNWETSFYYAVSGIIGELQASLVGIGYTMPFETFMLPWLDSDKIADALNAEKMEGVHFRPIHYKPYYSNNKGKELSGVQIHITDFEKVNLTKIQFKFAEVLYGLCKMHPLFDIDKARYNMFDKVCGSDTIRKTFTKNYKYKDIEQLWEEPAKKFKADSKKYYLYK